MREDSTVGVKIAELLRLNISTLIVEQFSLKVQKTAEVTRTQFIDRVVNIPVVQQRQVQQFKMCRRSWRCTDSAPTVQTVQKIAEITQVQFWTRCRHVCCGATPSAHGSDGAENSWSSRKSERVRDCNRKSCGTSVDFDSLELKFGTSAIQMQINS